MYQNLKVEILSGLRNFKDDVEVMGEVMLMETADYVPDAVSAIAKLTKRAGGFVCQFEVDNESEHFETEACSGDPCLSLRLAEHQMKRKIRMWSTSNKTRPLRASGYFGKS